MRPLPLSDVSVYVHIPFCTSRCRYCDFYFETGWSPRVLGRTLDRIVEEAASFMEAANRPRVTTLYVGGGTPSVIPPRLLDDFLVRLREALRTGARGPDEWTFEANPESLGGELLAVLGGNGVTRISLGAQTFQDPLLRFLTRRASRETVLASLARIAAGRDGERIPHLNVDLMTGVPGQTEAMTLEDISLAMEFRPDHLSVYSLTVEERTPLFQMVARGDARMPARETQESIWFSARDRLVELGFDHYEISNFALPGARSRHNLAYWRLAPYLGLGPGAVSTIPGLLDGPLGEGERPLGAGEPGVLRLKNPNLFAYGSERAPGRGRAIEALSGAEFLLEHFLSGLRTSEGVSLDRIERVFAVDLAAAWRAPIERWEAAGRILSAPAGARRIVLGEASRMLLDPFLVEIAELIDGLGPLRVARWP